MLLDMMLKWSDDEEKSASDGTPGRFEGSADHKAIEAFLEELKDEEKEMLLRESRALSQSHLVDNRATVPTKEETVVLDEDGLEEVTIGGGIQSGGIVPDMADAMVHVDNFVEFEEEGELADVMTTNTEGFGETEEHSSLVDRPTVSVPTEVPPGLIEDPDEELISVEMIPKRVQGNDYSREAALEQVARDTVSVESPTRGEQDGITVTSPVTAFEYDKDFDYDATPLDRKF